jgi:hypothetical protein
VRVLITIIGAKAGGADKYLKVDRNAQNDPRLGSVYV